MPAESGNSIINLGEISKPADTLIKKVSKAVGGLVEPWQIRRVAKAQADAALIEAKNHIVITDLHRRAVARMIEEEARKQENIESITSRAIPHLNEGADAGSIDDDWVANFFQKARVVSNEEMQERLIPVGPVPRNVVIVGSAWRRTYRERTGLGMHADVGFSTLAAAVSAPLPG